MQLKETREALNKFGKVCYTTSKIKTYKRN